jgi:hypothetical protein
VWTHCPCSKLHNLPISFTRCCVRVSLLLWPVTASAIRAAAQTRQVILRMRVGCTVYPGLNLVRDDFEVQVVADAGGSPGKMADVIAVCAENLVRLI